MENVHERMKILNKIKNEELIELSSKELYELGKKISFPSKNFCTGKNKADVINKIYFYFSHPINSMIIAGGAWR